jgi:serine/threonine protein kinase/Tfp pilus assembly protein PilF
LDERARPFLEMPAVQLVAASLAGEEPQPASRPAAGSRIGPYRIGARLGGGGMGEVYTARDTRLERDLALKLLPADSSRDALALKRFRREARAASALNHPHICTVHDVGEHDGQPYLVMELLDGASLKDRLEYGPLPPAELVNLALQIADALEAAHAKGIVHRDVKPGNIFVTSRGQAKVLDFGLAKLLDEPPRAVEAPAGGNADRPANGQEIVTVSGAAMGTAAYMSPEQARGEEVDERTDIFSLGVTLYQAATGRLPFQETTAKSTREAILTRQPPPPGQWNAEVPAELERIIGKALEKEPARRYQDAVELTADLERLKERLAGGRKRRWPSAVTLAAASVLGAAALFAWMVQLRTPSPEHPAASPGVQSLAVLPLHNASGDPEQEYLADGLTGALIGSLARITSLRVISRPSAMQYKGATKPRLEIARELRVDGLVEGSMARFGDRVRISIALVRASDQRRLWAESYERDLGEVPAWQNEVAHAVAREVRIELTRAEAQRLSGGRRVNREAFEAYLRGHYFLNKRSEESIRTATTHFRAAIDRDPAYAAAYAGLADCYNQLGTVLVGSQPPSRTRPLATAAAANALAIDGELAEAHAALGFAKLYDWNWSGAERSFQRAIELNPSYAPAHSWYAGYLVYTGRNAEALREAARAGDLDPLSLIMRTQVGWTMNFLRQYDSAIEQYQRVLAVDPDYAWALWQLGQTYTYKGMFPEAFAVLQRGVEVSNRSPAILGTLGAAYAMAGRKAQAEQIADELSALSRKKYVPPAAVAWVYLGLRDADRAFQWLEAAYLERSNALAAVKVWQMLDPFRSDPRYFDLARRIGPHDATGLPSGAVVQP